MAVQFLWALILGVGLFLLPESPRWYVKKGRVDAASTALGRIRGQPADSDYVQQELAEIIANHEYETALIPSETYFASWAACFSGSIADPGSNLRRTILGISLQVSEPPALGTFADIPDDATTHRQVVGYIKQQLVASD